MCHSFNSLSSSCCCNPKSYSVVMLFVVLSERKREGVVCRDRRFDCDGGTLTDADAL